MDHQTQGVEWLRARNWCGLLFWDCGVAKTFPALECIRQQGFKPTIICVPASIKSQWREETKKYLEITPTVIEGTPEERKKLWESETSPIFICNPEQIVNDFDIISKRKWHTMILDECQLEKNPVTKRSKAIKKIPVVSRIALSGTPCPNDLWELWNIASWIQPGILGRNFFAFKQEWCVTHPVFRSKVTGYRNKDKLLEILKTTYLRIQEKDTDMQLPELITTIIYVELPEEERKRYNHFRDELVLEINAEETISVPNVVSKILRLRQLTDHPSSLGLQYQSAKERALKEWYRERDRRCIIFTEWQTKAQELSRELSIPVICGSTDQKERVQILQTAVYNKCGLVATSALETGANCQWADAIVHYSLPWNWARYCQRNGRSRRKGRTQSVESVVFLVRDTVDEYLWKMINKKKLLQESLSKQDYIDMLR